MAALDDIAFLIQSLPASTAGENSANRHQTSSQQGPFLRHRFIDMLMSEAYLAYM